MTIKKPPKIGREVQVTVPDARGVGETVYTGKVALHLSTMFVVSLDEGYRHIFMNDNDWRYL